MQNNGVDLNQYSKEHSVNSVAQFGCYLPIIIIALSLLTLVDYVGWIAWVAIALITYCSVSGVITVYNKAGKTDLSKANMYFYKTNIEKQTNNYNPLPISARNMNYISIAAILLCGMWYFALIRGVMVYIGLVFEKSLYKSAQRVTQDASKWAADNPSKADKNLSEIGKVERI